jgi:hypothetical protein
VCTILGLPQVLLPAPDIWEVFKVLKTDFGNMKGLTIFFEICVLFDVGLDVQIFSSFTKNMIQNPAKNGNKITIVVNFIPSIFFCFDLKKNNFMPLVLSGLPFKVGRGVNPSKIVEAFFPEEMFIYSV